MDKLHHDIYAYQLQQNIYNKTSDDFFFSNLINYMSITQPLTVEKSNVVYYKVIDAIADQKDTVLAVLHSLYATYINGKGLDYLIVEGDAKLYDVLQSIKFEYGSEFKWLLPMTGDWHLLKKFQIALMKPYSEGGLKELARVSGYLVAAIQRCSQFKRTNYFILETWEAVYQVMVTKFLQYGEGREPTLTLMDILTTANNRATREEGKIAEIITEVQESINNLKHFDAFTSFIEEMSKKNLTWKFWAQFVLKDALAYVALFIALRSGNWDLRLASLKLMAPIFSAYDHFTCKKIIAQNLADILLLPPSVLSCLKQGGFSVSLTGHPWHSVAVDEAHEMGINKACKTSIV